MTRRTTIWPLLAIIWAVLSIATPSYAQETVEASEGESATTEVSFDIEKTETVVIGESVRPVEEYDPSPESGSDGAGARNNGRYRFKPGYGYAVEGRYKMAVYTQGQMPWGPRPFGGVSGNPSMASSGCGPTMLAMAGRTLTGKRRYTPSALAYRFRWVYSGRVNWFTPGARDAISQAGRWMGLRTRRLGRDLNLAARTVKRGGLVGALFGPGKFTSAGHYMLLISAGNGKFKFADPNRGRFKGVGFTADQLRANGLLQLWGFERRR